MSVLRWSAAAFALAAASAWAQTPPPELLFTTYNHVEGGHSINWLTCGYTTGSSGCYGSGSIGPFGHACAVLGVGEMVYVADTDATVSGGVHTTALRVYKQVRSSSPSVTLSKTIRVPLAASTDAQCWMSTVGDIIYFGTSQSSNFFKIDRKSGEVVQAGICGTPTTGIYAHGDFVVVNQGDCAGWYTRYGRGEMSGGSSGTNFFPNPSASVPLR